MANAYQIEKAAILMEDIRGKMKDMLVDTPDESAMQEILISAKRSLECNESYWEAYWLSIESAIELILHNE
jgi:hypothetical protein